MSFRRSVRFFDIDLKVVQHPAHSSRLSFARSAPLAPSVSRALSGRGIGLGGLGWPVVLIVLGVGVPARHDQLAQDAGDQPDHDPAYDAYTHLLLLPPFYPVLLARVVPPFRRTLRALIRRGG